MKDIYNEVYQKVYDFWELIGRYIIFMYGSGMIIAMIIGKISLVLAWIWFIISVATIFILFFVFNKGKIIHGLEGDV